MRPLLEVHGERASGLLCLPLSVPAYAAVAVAPRARTQEHIHTCLSLLSHLSVTVQIVRSHSSGVKLSHVRQRVMRERMQKKKEEEEEEEKDEEEIGREREKK